MKSAGLLNRLACVRLISATNLIIPTPASAANGGEGVEDG